MDKKTANKIDLKITMVLALISAIGIIFTIMFQINTMPAEIFDTIPKEVVIAISFIQSMIMVILMSYAGLKLSRATNLNKGILDVIYSGDSKLEYKVKLIQNVKIALLLAFILSGVMTISEKFIWARYIPQISTFYEGLNPIYLLVGMIYGGVVEEIMLRLFAMSLIVFILFKVFKREKSKFDIPTSFYVISIILTALLFGLGHMPATIQIFGGLTTPIVLRMIIMNGIPGVVFGYLYFKKGIEYAMVSHMFIHFFNQLVWMPIIF